MFVPIFEVQTPQSLPGFHQNQVANLILNQFQMYHQDLVRRAANQIQNYLEFLSFFSPIHPPNFPQPDLQLDQRRINPIPLCSQQPLLDLRLLKNPLEFVIQD